MMAVVPSRVRVMVRNMSKDDDRSSDNGSDTGSSAEEDTSNEEVVVVVSDSGKSGLNGKINTGGKK